MFYTITSIALLLSSSGYSSNESDNSRFMPRETHIINPQNKTDLYGSELQQRPEAAIITILPETPNIQSTPKLDFKDFDAAEVREKTRQLKIMGGSIAALTGLTLYYACTTQPSEWLSGTAGSYCTNTVLTSMGAYFLYRDRENMKKRQAANK